MSCRIIILTLGNEESYFFGEIDVCLILSWFDYLGYKGVFKKRTREKPDGCAIFWRNGVFSFQAKLGIDLYQPHIPLLDRDNVGLLVKLRSRFGKHPTLIVGTTHLLYNPKRNVRDSLFSRLLVNIRQISKSASSFTEQSDKLTQLSFFTYCSM